MNEGKYVIVRGDRSGVFAGTLVSQEDCKVVLSGVRSCGAGTVLPSACRSQPRALRDPRIADSP